MDTPTPARVGSRLTWRLFALVVGVVMVAVTVTLALLGVASARVADAARAEALDRAAQLATTLLTGREHGLTRASAVFVQNPLFRSLVLAETIDDLNDQSAEGADRIGAAWVQILNGAGERLARSDDASAPRTSLAASALVSRALDGEPAAGFGTQGDSLLLQVIAVPIQVPSSSTQQSIGVFMAAQVIDSALAAQVKSATATDIIFFVTDTAGTPHVTASTLGTIGELATLVHSTSDSTLATRFDATVQERAYTGRWVELRSAGGEPLGGFVALRPRDADMAAFVSLRQWIVVAGLLSLLFGGAAAFFVARSIARPVLEIAHAATLAADGDYDVQIAFSSADEVGTLADAVRTMFTDLREKRALVQLLSTAPLGAANGLPSGATPIEVGRVVGARYEVKSLLGSGGAGIVYKVFDLELQEFIALKTLHADALVHDPNALERLKSEIRLARGIAHRGIVRTYDLGESEGTYFLTMEYIAGTPLSEVLAREQRLPVRAVFAIARQLARALETAHELGVVHRDIKPQNIMIQPDGTLKVMDFGIARLATRSTSLTQVGVVLGTPGYMAPEQLLDGDVDARADLYACGALLYECLTGQLPHDPTNPVTLIGRLLSRAVVPAPRELAPEVPAALSLLIMRLLAFDPGDRPASAAALHDDLVAAEAPAA